MLEGMALGVLFLLVYIGGLNTGLRLAKSGMKEEVKIPNPIVKVAEVVQDTKEAIATKERDFLIMEGLNNIFTFDGTPQKGASK